MAPPSSESKPMYQKDEKALCFHGELLYEAKVLEVKRQDPKDKTSPYEYRVHYKGWKNTWDDWVPQDRLRKLTDDNRELAANLRRELLAQNAQNAQKSVSKPIGKTRRGQDSELGSGRGSEERTSSIPAGGARGSKRARDQEIEKRRRTVIPPDGSRESEPPQAPSTTGLGERDNAYWTQERQKQMRTESIYDILVRPAPPDEPEQVSKATAQKRPKQRFASLIGGTTMQEKEAIEEELEEELEQAGGLTRDVDSNLNLETTSVDKDPLYIDPPRRVGPFDALGLPARLIRHPNRDDGETLINPSEQPSLKIQSRLMAKPHSQNLATMPSHVLINQLSAVQDTLSTDHRLLEEPSRRDEEEEVRHRSATPRSVRKTRNSMPATSTKIDMPETENLSLPSGRERSTPHSTTGGRREEEDVPRRIAVPRAIRKARNSRSTTSSSVDLAETGSSVLPSIRGRSTPGSSTSATPLSFGGSTQSTNGMLPPAGKPSATVAVEESAEDQGPCNTCVAMGIRCNRQKPECHWCRHAGYECSFKIESYKLSTTDAVEESAEDQGPCTTCVAMGIRCNRQKPECHWCRHAGYECSFKTVPTKPVTNLVDDSMTDFVRTLNMNTDTAHPDPGLDTRVPKNLQPKPNFGQERDVEKKGNRKRNAKQLRRTQLFDRDGNFVTPEQDRIAYTTPSTQEENYHNRPSIRISIPDHLKNLLVDDWENVTKSLLLVPLPSQAPANFILDEYFNEEKTNRRLGSVEADILEEFCSGLKTYFEKAIGKILLYRFERPQLNDVRKLWESGKFKDWDGKGPGDCYGAEHLTRMIVNLPEIVAQTNMDTESVARLKSELSKFSTWLSRNSGRFFCAKYEKPTAEYIESAR